MKTDLFQSCGHCWVFQICCHIECSTFTASSLRIWNSSTGIPSPPLDLFVVMLSKAHLISHSGMSVLFLSQHKLEWWTNVCLKQQTSYSSVPLKQTDFLLDRHSQDTGAGWPQSGCLPHPYWLPLFILPVSSFWLCPVQNRACTYHQSKKGNTNGHTLKANWQLQVI